VRVLAVAALLAVGCPSTGTSRPAAPQLRVVVETAAGARHAVAVELADSEEERALGLMYRKSLPPDAGMLFRFDESSDHVFWMRNTLVPLDMIFADEGGIVVGIVEGATPLSDQPRTVGAPSRYVLEVNAGWARAHGVRPGDRLRLENAPRF